MRRSSFGKAWVRVLLTALTCVPALTVSAQETGTGLEAAFYGSDRFLVVVAILLIILAGMVTLPLAVLSSCVLSAVRPLVRRCDVTRRNTAIVNLQRLNQLVDEICYIVVYEYNRYDSRSQCCCTPTVTDVTE